MATETEVEAKLAEIRTSMPETYKCIQAKAAEIGKLAYALVRRSLRGEPNCFYAIERKCCVGTPVRLGNIQAVVAQWMMQFGCNLVVMWGPEGSPPATVQTSARGQEMTT